MPAVTSENKIQSVPPTGVACLCCIHSWTLRTQTLQHAEPESSDVISLNACDQFNTQATLDNLLIQEKEAICDLTGGFPPAGHSLVSLITGISI